jgi:hypothetical protein
MAQLIPLTLLLINKKDAVDPTSFWLDEKVVLISKDSRMYLAIYLAIYLLVYLICL